MAKRKKNKGGGAPKKSAKTKIEGTPKKSAKNKIEGVPKKSAKQQKAERPTEAKSSAADYSSTAQVDPGDQAVAPTDVQVPIWDTPKGNTTLLTFAALDAGADGVAFMPKEELARFAAARVEAQKAIEPQMAALYRQLRDLMHTMSALPPCAHVTRASSPEGTVHLKLGPQLQHIAELMADITGSDTPEAQLARARAEALRPGYRNMIGVLLWTTCQAFEMVDSWYRESLLPRPVAKQGRRRDVLKERLGDFLDVEGKSAQTGRTTGQSAAAVRKARSRRRKKTGK